MNTIYRIIFSIFVALFLASCSGNNSNPSSSTSPVPGFFKGTTFHDFALSAILLEDGTYWGLYGAQSADGFVVQGLNRGQLHLGNGVFRLSYTDFPIPGNLAIPGRGFGSYTPSSLEGTLAESGHTQAINLTLLPSTIFDFNTPASISSVNGTWSGKLLNGEATTIHILADGSMIGLSSTGCSYTGKFTPRPSGINILDLTLQFGPAPCFIPNQTATGMALTFSSGDGTATLFFAAATPTLTAGTAFYGTR